MFEKIKAFNYSILKNNHLIKKENLNKIKKLFIYYPLQLLNKDLILIFDLILLFNNESLIYYTDNNSIILAFDEFWKKAIIYYRKIINN